MNKAVRVIISGRVQGVGFRAWTVANAQGMNLKGWVRNAYDGTVEAVFSGDSSVIEAMIDACRDGPPAARVTDIERYDWDEEVDEKPFTSRPTA